MIKAVFFDVDGVLLDSFEANYTFYSDLMTKFGYSAPTRELYKTMFHLPLNEVIRQMTKSTDEAHIQEVWDASKHGDIPYRDELMIAPKGMAEVVEALSKKYILGVVTSRIKGFLFEFPVMAPLKKHFQVDVYFEDTVNHKPHPEPLLYAAQKVNIDPSEVVYIGDAATDILAAKSAGMKMILYSKNKMEGADKHTEIFTDIPKLISLFS